MITRFRLLRLAVSALLVWALAWAPLPRALAAPARDMADPSEEISPEPPRIQYLPMPMPSPEESEPPQLDEAIDTPGAILDYGVGIRDRLAINVWSDKMRYQQDVVIPLEGRIFVPPVGELQVVGLTTRQIEARLWRLVQARSAGAQVSVLLTRTHTIRVYVTGLVKRPGQYAVNALARFSSALVLAGGVLPEGSMRRITIRRGGREQRVDWLRFIRFGEAAQNPRLKGGDVIVVPPVDRLAIINGAVHKGGTYEFLPGETVASLLAFANGPSMDAVLSQIRIAEQPTGSGDRVERVIDLTTPQGRQTRLQHRAVVAVPANTRTYVQAPLTRVQVTGEVLNPREYQLTVGNTLRDLLLISGGPKPTAGLREVKIYRRAVNGTIRHDDAQVVDAYRLLYENDESQNVQLQDGDVVAVPAGKNPTEASAVFVYGQVLKPGKAPYRSGYRLSDYLNAVGGPLPNANLGGVTVTRVREKERQKLNVDAYKVMREGRQDLDPVLQEGDIVNVPESFMSVANLSDLVNIILAGAAVWSLFRP